MSPIKVLATLVLFVAISCASPIQETNTIEDTLAHYIQNQEINFDLPAVGSAVSLSARNLDDDEVDVKVKLSTGAEARKSSKLKKIFAPILILVILKAITLIPLALGLLSLKTWNALQLAFVTFIISISLGVYELCKKIAADHVPPVITHSAPWRSRSMDDDEEEEAQKMAYSAYAN
ncbi:PREDICTED: uncharacterized protein LOC108558226 [Nicrophorus vespilloides]|uniref:Uncharacterized protein LOC108558226 n=1 Tax=Nicrophorus vespilloides TaxID=110193 RepID=A0ABM1M7K6_NICVS|nr:PREDICTED: uncharacterized protein LOC108558226 [Nicrophorus vespilloides]